MPPRKKRGGFAIPPQPDAGVEETSFAAEVQITPPPPPEGRRLSTPHLEVQPLPGSGAVTPEIGDDARDYGSTASAREREPAAPDASPPDRSHGRKSPARALAPDILRGLLMALMVVDHNTLALLSWPKSTALGGESDSTVVHEWNRPLPYVLRSLSHVCAPGFTFLLGMGVVYFGRSRTNQGWTAGRMAWHFAVRAAVMTALTPALGYAITLGDFWFLNTCLFSLAVDYLLAGLLWLAISRTEKSLAGAVLRVLPDAKQDDAREPLLQSREGVADGASPDRKIIRAANLSWHIHNAVLLALVIVTSWWNMWLSPTGGHCEAEDGTTLTAANLPTSNWFRIWFYVIVMPRFASLFPPLAWLSFAILGLLYGRIILARAWSGRAIVAGNALAGLAFLSLFALTRVYRFGNLSEGCLRMPEHLAHPDGNPYLASAASYFYIVKYPPDVAFGAWTMGVNFLLLGLFSAAPPRLATRWGKVLLVYGGSALFFFVVHHLFVFGFAYFARQLLGHPTGDKDPWTGDDAVGVDSLWGYWGHYILVMACMYFLCLGYGTFKARQGPDSLWRFF